MISVIVPVYNEEKIIKQFLGSFSYNHSFEMIVVDGNSCDRTKELAQGFAVKVVECIKNRALQMNRGAQTAQGDVFLFLHCDCLPEEGSLEVIEDYLRDGYSGGCFSQRIRSPGLIYRFIEGSGNLRARLSKIFYGDQAIFVRKDIFLKAGGFDNVPLFEDILFSKKIAREGKTCVLSKKVFVSPRRWMKKGIIKATIIFSVLTLGFYLGIPYNRLKRLYPDIR